MELKVFSLGLVDFEEALRFQRDTFKQVMEGSIDNALVLCRHYPVITKGRSAKPGSIIASSSQLEKIGISLYEIERGGDVTYHGPGQLTAYPIFNLEHIKKDIRFFLRGLEEVVIELLASFDVKGERQEGATGVWIEGRKIASIGIAVRRWVTFHGVSINIKKDDLGNFRLIKPCGMDIEMTSLEIASGRDINLSEIAGILSDNLRKRFITAN